MNIKYDNINSTALKNTKAYEFYFNKFNHFTLTFQFLTPEERNLHCSHEIMLRTKLFYPYIINFFNTTTYLTQPHQTHSIDLHSVTPNTHHHISLFLFIV